MGNNPGLEAIILRELTARERGFFQPAPAQRQQGRIVESEVSAQINEGALLIFDQALTDQHIADISNSILFSQLAADKQFSRKESAVDWQKVFLSTFSVLGWTDVSIKTGSSKKEPPVNWAKSITALLSGEALRLGKTGISACQALPQASPALKIWNDATVDTDGGTLMVGSCQTSGGSPILTMATIGFTLQQAVGSFLEWTLIYSLNSSCISSELNEDIYAQLRKTIIDKLGDRPKYLVADVPITTGDSQNDRYIHPSETGMAGPVAR